MESPLSSERNDMNCPIGVDQVDMMMSLDELPRRLTPRAGRPLCVEQPLSCVWSDAAGGWSCHSHIPKAVVTNGWNRELDWGVEREDRFFHFIWRGGVWLAYGLKDGHVRGVYCPFHNSERAERSHAAICAPGEIAYELPLAA
jgi:hypothetical protein